MIYDPIRTSNLKLRLGSCSGCEMTSGSAAIHDLDARLNFTAADVGLPIFVIFSSSVAYNTTVATVIDTTHATLTDVAPASTDGASTNTTLFRERNKPFIGSTMLQSSLTAHDTLSFTYLDTDGLTADLTPVLLTLEYGGTTHMFGGVIDQLKATNVPGSPLMEQMVDCVSWDKFVYRRVTGLPSETSGSPAITNPDAGVYTNKTVKQVFQSITSNALGGDGLSLQAIDGPVLPTFEVDYASCGDAFDQAVKAGSDGVTILHWFVSPTKVITLQDETTVNAPWGVTDATAESLLSVVSCTWDGSEFITKAFVRASSFITAPVTTPFAGDGVTRTFDLALPSYSVPVITRDDGGGPVAQTVGISGVDTGKDWYWQQGSTAITQDAGGAVLAVGQSITTVGPQIGSTIVEYQNDAAVDATTAIQSGSGLQEIVEQTNNPATQTDAVTLARAIATQYGVIPALLEIKTYRPGLQIGQRFPVQLSKFGLDQDFVIDAVTVTTEDNLVLWTVHAVGSPLINWDYRATLATLRPGGGDPGSGGGQVVPWQAVAVLPGVQSVRTDVTANWRRIVVNLDGVGVNLIGAYITAKVAPVTSAFIADWLVSQDEGTTWTSILPAGNANKIVLPVGVRTTAIAPTWTLNPLLEGWLNRVDVLQSDGACSGIEIELYGAVQ